MENHFSPNNKCCVMIVIVTLGFFLAPMWAGSAGLGDVTVRSQLGQPLRAEVRVTAANDELEGMVAHLASQDAHAQAGIRFPAAARLLRFTLEKAAGGAVIKVTSEKPINDPFMDFMLELSWPTGRVTREYTFLIDPQDLPAKPSGVASTKAPSVVLAATPTVVSQTGKAAATGEHVVKSGETLFRIATANLPAGATLEQMQVALYRNNPHAFDGRITRLRVGSVLKIPALADVTAISQDEARRVLRASRVASPGKAGGVKQNIPAAPNTKTKKKPATGPTKAELDARRREFRARVDRMQQEVAKLQEQVESKNEALARIERLKAEKKAALEAAAAAASAQAGAKTEGSEVVEPPAPPAPDAPPPAPSEDSTGSIASNDPDDVGTTDEPKSAVEPPPVPSSGQQRPVPKPPTGLDAQEEPEEAGGVLIWILAGVGALVALLVGFMFLRRRGDNDYGDSLVGDSLATTSLSMPRTSVEPPSREFAVSKGPSSVFQNTGAGGQSVDTGNTTAPPSISGISRTGGLGAIDTDEVDPVAEADVYMAYGRDGQAEEILLDAMQKDPQRLAIPVKLLEVYASRKSVKDFETLASELYTRTGGQGAEWEKVLELGRALDADNPLYGRSGAGASSFESGVAASAAGGDAEFDLLATDTSAKSASQPVSPQADFAKSDSFSFSLDSSSPVATASSPAGAAAPEEDPLLSLLQEESIAGAKSDQGFLDGGARTPPSAPKNKPAPVDFGFDVEQSEAPAPSTPEPTSEYEPTTISQAILDFDLGGDSVAPTSDHYDESESDIAATVVNPDAVSGDIAATAINPVAVSGDIAATVINPVAVSGDIAATVINPVAVSGDIAATVINPAAVSMESGSGKPEASGNLLNFELEVPEVVRPHAASQDDEVGDDLSTTSIMSIDPDDDMEFDVRLTESTVLGNPGGTGFNLSGISLDLAAANAAPSEAPAASEVLAEELEDSTVLDPHRDEVNTKLDLAKAYEEMGDLEGARELLDEVVDEGAPDQIAEARAMLARLNV
jgi:pilus assembly protein FimV